MYAESDSLSGYHKKLEQQSQLIGDCLQCLHSLGIEYDFNFNEFDPAAEYKAFQFIKKHWQKLRKAGLDWPRKYLNHYSLSAVTTDGATVRNLTKGSQYELTWIGDDELSCTCQAYESGNDCGHIQYALEFLRPTESKVVISSSAKQSLFKLIDKNIDQQVAEHELELLPGITATSEQAIALKELIEFANGDKAIHGLFGFSGTGKTLLLQGWLSALRQSGYEKSIVFTAFSNKAVNVLQGMVDRWNLDIECQTCAKLLGLKPKIDIKNGEQYFDKAYGEESTIQDYAIVVVDECSMVGSTKTRKGLWEHLTESAGFFTKLLFVGDYAQLPPVNEPISKVFLEVNEPSNLTQVKRYRGAIAEVASEIRENLGRKSEPYFQTGYSDDGSEGLFVLKSGTWNPEKLHDTGCWEKTIIKAFSSDKYQLDPNYVRCLAWTNKRIQELNQNIREAIKGKNAPRFVEGERLIANEHFLRKKFGENEGFPTSQEMEVVDVFEGSQDGFKCWYLTVILFNKEGSRLCFPVLHEDSRKEFEADQEDLKKSKQWRLYYEKHQQFAWIDYAYAMTIHKSQGSTFNNVFVDVPDVLKDKQRNTFTWPSGEKQLIYERNQLLYVALTRASHRVFIYE